MKFWQAVGENEENSFAPILRNSMTRTTFPTRLRIIKKFLSTEKNDYSVKTQFRLILKLSARKFLSCL